MKHIIRRPQETILAPHERFLFQTFSSPILTLLHFTFTLTLHIKASLSHHIKYFFSQTFSFPILTQLHFTVSNGVSQRQLLPGRTTTGRFHSGTGKGKEIF